ncbi:MAG: homoserine kinase [Acidaminococcaceae bacterium]|nr:homoserine kinase [Acidaminococcaceae bacterium]
MNKKVTVRVPATSANCGPGFDTLGLACNLYNYFTYELIDQGLSLKIEGEGTEKLKAGKNNLAFLSFYKVWDMIVGSKTGLSVIMSNNIPLSRGLGSSSTAIVAGLVAANHLTGNTLSKNEIVQLATEIEGHPDNVAPAILGGMTISYVDNGRASSLKFLPLKPFKLVAVVPDMPLATSLARRAIPKTVPHQDAVFNTSRAALLVGAMLTGDYQHLAAGLDDRLHQPYRAHLIPGMEDAFKAAVNNGAFNAIISGAGSTLMAYVPINVSCEAVGEAMCKALSEHDLHSVFHILDIDTEGAVVL